MPIGSIGFGFLAGVFSILSPCVLPVLPLVLGPAVAAHRLGLAALAAGLVLSFVTIGLFVATIGFAMGLDGDLVRILAAGVLAVLGLTLLSGALQALFARGLSGVAQAGNGLLARVTPAGLSGQFLLGLLLGAVWSPCVGPTLGAASVLAAQGRDLASVAAVMAAFGAGTALPLILLGLASRSAMQRWRGRLLKAGQGGKVALGFGALAVAGLILTGADRALESTLVIASPTWLTDLTTRF